MKISRLFIIALVLLFAVMLAVEFSRPMPFKWDDTYAHRDKNPLGCAVIDSVMAASLPNGYSVTSATLGQIDRMNSPERVTYIVIQNYYDTDEQKRIINLLDRHNNVVIFASWISESTIWDSENETYVYDEKTFIEKNPLFYQLGVVDITEYRGSTNFSKYFIDRIFTNKKYVTYRWKAGAGGYPTTLTTKSLRDFHTSSIHAHKGTPIITLEFVNYSNSSSQDSTLFNDTTAMMFNYKYGKVIIVSDPLLFTNFSLLTFNQSPMLMRLLSQVSDYPVVRIDPSMQGEKYKNSETPFRVLLDYTPLRWALYLTLALVALLMFFTARRRQRVIPVEKPPANLSLGMIEHIGSLYFQRRDNADLLRKKYNFFVEDIRRATMIDLDDTDHYGDNLAALQGATGIPGDELRHSIDNIRGWIETGARPSNKALMQSIDFLNYVLKKL